MTQLFRARVLYVEAYRRAEDENGEVLAPATKEKT